MPTRHIDDPQYLRRRAQAARAQAEQMETETKRQLVLHIAVQYDLLADEAEERLKQKTGGET